MSSDELKNAIAFMSGDTDKTEVLRAAPTIDEVTGYCSSLGTLLWQMRKEAEHIGACSCLLLLQIIIV